MSKERIILPSGDQYKIKKDHYQRVRGKPHILAIHCSKCNELLLIYQKDGPGPLKRCYLDRIAWTSFKGDLKEQSLKCPNCSQIIAHPMIYKKEKRPAIKMIRQRFVIKNYHRKS